MGNNRSCIGSKVTEQVNEPSTNSTIDKRMLQNKMTTEQENEMQISTLGNNAWDNYIWQLKDEEGFDPGWELILEDFYQSELFMTVSQFLDIISNIIGNLFVGCKEAMSPNVQNDFEEFIVEKTKNALQEKCKPKFKSFAWKYLCTYSKMTLLKVKKFKWFAAW